MGSENCVAVVTCIRSSSVLDVHTYSAEYYYYDCSYCTTLLQLHHSVLRVCSSGTVVIMMALRSSMGIVLK